MPPFLPEYHQYGRLKPHRSLIIRTVLVEKFQIAGEISCNLRMLDILDYHVLIHGFLQFFIYPYQSGQILPSSWSSKIFAIYCALPSSKNRPVLYSDRKSLQGERLLRKHTLSMRQNPAPPGFSSHGPWSPHQIHGPIYCTPADSRQTTISQPSGILWLPKVLH